MASTICTSASMVSSLIPLLFISSGMLSQALTMFVSIMSRASFCWAVEKWPKNSFFICFNRVYLPDPPEPETISARISALQGTFCAGSPVQAQIEDNRYSASMRFTVLLTNPEGGSWWHVLDWLCPAWLYGQSLGISRRPLAYRSLSRSIQAEVRATSSSTRITATRNDSRRWGILE